MLWIIFLQLCLFFENKTAKPQDLELRLMHHFGQEKLALQKKYVTLLGDTIELTRFSYYLSNIELIDEKGKVWKEKESYHYFNLQNNPTWTLQLKEIPNKTFKKIRFSIGIDSIRNSKGSQTGALDPLNGMFWTWAQGYVFLKVEGYCYASSDSRKGLVVHIGNTQNYKTLEFDLKSSADKVIDCHADIQKLFGGFPDASFDLKIADTGSINVMAGDKAQKIANNLMKLFGLADR